MEWNGKTMKTIDVRIGPCISGDDESRRMMLKWHWSSSVKDCGLWS